MTDDIKVFYMEMRVGLLKTVALFVLRVVLGCNCLTRVYFGDCIRFLVALP